jgi:integrase
MTDLNTGSTSKAQLTLRSAKGFIAIGVNGGYLRLQFPRTIFEDGKQRYVSLKLKDTPENRAIADNKAREAQNDLTRYQLGDANAFDFTLAKYKLDEVARPPVQSEEPSLGELWGQYSAYKSIDASPSTIAKDYLKTERLIQKLPTQSLDEALQIRDYLRSSCTPNAAKRYMTQINACCEWALVSGFISRNPFILLKKTLALPKGQRKNYDVVKHFTAEQRDEILQAFKNHRYYNHYYNYVFFCFFTGCRPSEAIALRWENISRTHIHFDTTVVEGLDGLTEKDGLKTQNARDFQMNTPLREFMEFIKPENAKPEDLVFPSPTGKWIDPHNFNNRAWKSVLESLPNVPKLPPYHTRHTFITLCLEKGIHEKDIKRWCGNSAAVIISAYVCF